MKPQKDCFNEQDDATLVACVLAGERDAFDTLFQRHAPSVQRLCTMLLGTTVEAQDIAQEAALQAFLGLSHLREPARFAAWFRAIAANLARSALRRRSEHSLEQLGEETIRELLWVDPSSTVEEYLLAREIQETIALALQDLSPAHREAVMGFYLQGYRYQELAEHLGIPLSTLKWRLFEGRKLLKTFLQPLAETLLYPTESPHRKGKNMMIGDLVTLHVDSLRRWLFTRQYQVVLRDPASSRALPVSLSEAEFNPLEVAFRVRQTTDALSFPQDLAQRLLESFQADLQQVVINALAGQTLYATATIKQGKRLREVDMRLAEALVLAVRVDAPIFIERSLFETTASRAQTHFASLSADEDLLPKGKERQNLGREERLQWEEAVRHRYTTTRSKRPEPFWVRLWAMLLVSLTGSPDAISETELRTLDFATTFPTREITWDTQPMLAIRLLDQRETSWLLVPPALWKKITQQWQALRDPGQSNEPAPLATNPVADVLTPRVQQQAEEILARLVELPEVRTALLLNPGGKVSVWNGPETQETLQRSCDASKDLSRPLLAPEHEPGQQGQNVFVQFFVKPLVPEQEQPETPGANRLLFFHRSGWRLVVFFGESHAEEVKEETHQRVEAAWREVLYLLGQPVSD
jgi:RNA polymerase sigma-70 factor, ECF subfamily